MHGKRLVINTFFEAVEVYDASMVIKVKLIPHMQEFYD